MKKKLPNKKSEEKLLIKAILVSFLTQKMPRILICLVLFIGGIVILFLRIPGWSLILGLPATQIGMILLIFSFNEVARKELSPKGLKIISCKICEEATLASADEKEKICSECREKLAKKIKSKED